MSVAIQRRRGTTSQHGSFIGKPGEITVDTTLNVIRVHDGVTVGGTPQARADHTHSIATDISNGFLSAADKTKLDALTVFGSLQYQTVQSAGVDQPEEVILNFESNFLLADDPGGTRTTVDLADTGVGTGTYTKVSVDAKGRVTHGTVLTGSDIPNITSSKITDLAVTVQAYPLNLFAVPQSDLNMNGHKIGNLADPTSPSDATTKNYVDNLAVGLAFKAACRVATNSVNVNLSAPGTTIDAVTLSNGDRVLIKDQSTQTQNGIYVFNGASSTMTRALDAANTGQLETGTFVFIEQGTQNGDTAWVCNTANPITIGTTNITFVQFASGSVFTAGNGINIISNVISVVSANTGRITVGGSGIDLAISGVTAGTYNNITVDVYGRATVGSNISYQALNANLTALAGLGTTGIIVRTGTNTFSVRSVQPGPGISVTNGDGVAGNVLLALETSGVGAGTYNSVTVDVYGRVTAATNIVETASPTANTLMLRDSAGRSQVAMPVASNDIANKAYVDASGGGEQTFISSGIFNVPSGVSRVWLFMVGGGGGGGCGNGTLSSSGGGGGAIIHGGPVPVTPSSNVTVTVGSGGSAGIGAGSGNPGGNGGASIFAGLITITAPGGSAGMPNTNNSLGGGNFLSSATSPITVGIMTVGGNGASGTDDTLGPPNGQGGGGGGAGGWPGLTGIGGQSALSGAGGNGGSNTFPGSNGVNGTSYGGGGGGGAELYGNGGVGAAGVVIVMW